jgi:hypothetical protein
MSGVAIVRALLAAHKPVTDVVPATRIYSGIAPQGVTLPAISVSTVYGDEFPTVARRNANKQNWESVQVTVLSSNYVQMKNLLKACSLGSGVHKGTVVGLKVNSVIPDGINPEIPPGDDKIFEQSRDFMVTFVEAN